MLIIKYIRASKENSLILYNVILEQQKTCLEDRISPREFFSIQKILIWKETLNLRTKTEGHFIQNQNILQIQSWRSLQQRIIGRKSTSSCHRIWYCLCATAFPACMLEGYGVIEACPKSNVEQDQIFCMKQLSGFLLEAVKVNLCCNGDSRELQIPNLQCIYQGKLQNRMELGKERCPK